MPLGPFAAHFATVLFARYPHWRAYVTIGESDSDDQSFDVSVPPPGRGRFPLEISVWHEVLLSYHRWHAHYEEPWAAEDDFREVMEKIDGFVAERLVMCRYRGGGAFSRASLEDRDHLKPLARKQRRFVRSWAGTFDGRR